MMNKRVLNSFLYGALLFSLGTGVVSCKITTRISKV